MNTLYGLDNLDAYIDIIEIQPLLDVIFPNNLNYVELLNYEETAEGTLESSVSRYSLIVALKQTISFEVPLLNSITLGVVADNPEKWPLLQIEIETSQDVTAVTLKYFPLHVKIDNPYLQTISNSEEDLGDGFEFEIEGTIKVGTDLTLQATLESFSLPLFTIVQSGMQFSLNECTIISHPNDVSPALETLGFDQNFRGIHALNAQFNWDIPFTLFGRQVPGIELDVENLAIGNQGLSVETTFDWDVVVANGRIDVPQSGMAGDLFQTGWQCALEQLQLNVQRNQITGSAATGLFRLGFLEQLVKVNLGYQYVTAELIKYAISFTEHNATPLVIPLGGIGNELSISDFSLSGNFTSTGEFTVSGQANILLSLPGIQFAANNLSFELRHTNVQDSLLLNLNNLELESFGEISECQLAIVFVKNNDEHELVQLELISQMAWLDLSNRFQLNNSISLLPKPLNNATVDLVLAWQQQTLHFSIKTELDSLDSLFEFLPSEFKPSVKDAAIDIELILEETEFVGELGVSCSLKLPEFTPHPLSDAITIISGDEDGWIDVRISANMLSNNPDNEENSETSAGLQVQLKDLISIQMQIPGLPLPNAPVTIELQEIFLALNNEQQGVKGEMKFTGDFQLHPILPNFIQTAAPPQIIELLDRLLAVAKGADLTGRAELLIGFANDQIWLESALSFEQANIQLDLFDMLAQGLSSVNSMFGEQSSSEIDIDIEVSVELESIFLRLGSANTEADLPSTFAFGFNALLNFASVVDIPLVFELTDQKLSFGLAELIIPIVVPKLPFSTDDLFELKDESGSWDITTHWVNRLAPELDQLISNLSVAFDAVKEELIALKAAEAQNKQKIFELQYRTIPKLQTELFDSVGKRFIYQAVLAIHQKLSAVNRGQYEQYIELYQSNVDATLGWVGFDTQLTFNIKDAKFVLPFNNPSEIRVEGSASFGGVEPGSVFAPLADIELTLGISADAIYFALEGGIPSIPLPDFGRYPGSSAKLDKLAIGYGYAKNSLKIDFAGELILSNELIDDADTSDEVGAGIRLPKNSKLKFKLDLIPIVLGEVDFLLPLVDFDIDLHSEPPPPPPPMDGQCRPAWDGLQLIVPDVVQAGIKKFKYSPFYGPILAANGELALDLKLGNDEQGISYITDYSYIGPIAGVLIIPLLADTSPFFERLCTRIQLAGFGLSFDLTRPFPKPSPLLVFELLGLISEPTWEIDPNGDIANLMYAQLYHGKITAPPAVERMFPKFEGFDQDFSGRVNVASVIAIGQQIQSWLNEVNEMVVSSAEQASLQFDRISNESLNDNIQNLLSLLPLSMRFVERQGRWLSFDANAFFYLALPQDLVAHYQAKEGIINDDPQTGQNIKYQNNFESADLTDFEAFNFGLKRGQGNWTVQEGKLIQDNNVGDNSPARYGAMLIQKYIDIENGHISFNAKSSDNDGMGVIFHFQAKDSFYRFRMTEEQQRWHLDKIVKGKIETLFEQTAQFVKGKYYDIAVQLASNQNTGTHIQIWVDNKVWCNLIDESSELTHGLIGFDSWWNKGVEFDNIEIRQKSPLSLSVGRTIDEEQLQRLNEAFSLENQALPSIFNEFSARDAIAAMPTDRQASVIVASEVKIFEQHRMFMLGYIKSNGEFNLLSGLDVSPFELAIAGITLPIPIQLSARASLKGKSAGANSFVKLTTLFYADWIILSGTFTNEPSVRLLIGSSEKPISLIMTSDLTFSIKGSAVLQLFGNALQISGELDASQAHCILNGDIDFAPQLTIAGKRLLSISGYSSGRIGPSNLLDLVGNGQIYLFEKAFVAGRIAITQNQISLSASLGSSRGRNPDVWSVAGFVLQEPRAQLLGEINFEDVLEGHFPQTKFQGDIAFGFFGANIEGKGQFEFSKNKWLLSVEGELKWLEQQWLMGKIRISDSGLTIHGKADFTLPLSAQQLGGNLQIAGMVLNLSLYGEFELNNLGQLVRWNAQLNWQLALQLPETENEQQSLPIASQNISLIGYNSGTNSLFELIELFEFDQLTLFDLSNISVPVPTIDMEDTTDFYPSLQQKTISGLSINLPIVTPNALDPDDEPNDLLFPVPPIYKQDTLFPLPTATVSIPTLKSEQNSNRSNILFSLPSFGTEQVNLGEFSLEDQFQLKLGWQRDKLGIIVKIGNNVAKFFAFPA